MAKRQQETVTGELITAKAAEILETKKFQYEGKEYTAMELAEEAGELERVIEGYHISEKMLALRAACRNLVEFDKVLEAVAWRNRWGRPPKGADDNLKKEFHPAPRVWTEAASIVRRFEDQIGRPPKPGTKVKIGPKEGKRKVVEIRHLADAKHALIEHRQMIGKAKPKQKDPVATAAKEMTKVGSKDFDPEKNRIAVTLANLAKVAKLIEESGAMEILDSLLDEVNRIASEHLAALQALEKEDAGKESEAA